MDRHDNQGTDAASIKPVSSLLSHFEGLKAQAKDAVDNANPKENDASRSRLGTPQPSFPTRASLDLPRSSSPWVSARDTGVSTPQRPLEPQKRSVSPSKSVHKRPMSMHLQSSPQLTPAVRVESPRSPPHMFFQRSSSRSPDRLDNTPFGKVRELISQQSSRSSTRASTPGPDHDIFTAKPTSNMGTRSKSPMKQPPPVNRAEKPKIPAKPLNFAQPRQGSLTPEPSRPSMEAKVSPFSTPPSSNDNSPSESPVRGGFPNFASGPSPFSPELASSPESMHTPGIETRLKSSGQNQGTTGAWDIVQVGAIQPGDARYLGFSAPASAPTSKDPRTLGLSAPAANVAERVSNAPPPPKAGLISSRAIPRDARSFGFSSSQPDVNVSTTAAAAAPLPRQAPVISSTLSSNQQPVYSRPTQLRDPRQFGFSSSNTSIVPREETARPDLPFRPGPPPPRPSEASKPAPKPSLRQSPPRNVDRTASSNDARPIRNNTLPKPEMNFPPPPKRNTFSDEEPSHRGTPNALAPASTSDKMSVAVPAQPGQADEDSDEIEMDLEQTSVRTDYPDSTQTNRRPPIHLSGLHEFHTKSDCKVSDACGRYFCAAHYVTRVFDMTTGDQVLGINHGETVKVSAVKFKPGFSPEDEGQRIWLGNNIGDLQEIDVKTQSIVGQSLIHNRREIVRILRYHRDLWTLDEDGKLFVWRADGNAAPSLKQHPIAQKTHRGHSFSIVVRDKLWLATGKEIHVYHPGSEAQFQVHSGPLYQPNTGDVSSGVYSGQRGGMVYFGHSDGKITMYSTTDYSCLGLVKVSDYKITGLAFIGDRLWTAYRTGKVYVYDTSVKPWKVKKDWPAHRGPAHGMLLDPSSVQTLQKLQVVTTGQDNYVRMWDAALEEDWLDSIMQERDVEYCTFRELRAAVVTWNVGASVPAMIRDDFIADAIHADDPPEVLVFGFQEVVDLEDRAVTAKSLLGFGKKKDPVTSEQHQSRVYREWRDYLARCINRFTGGRYVYSELHTSSLIGLFQCIFIRQEERRNVSMLSGSNVKCGMGGRYGNKGALVTRFVVDDSSLCFVNCHLAAGQTHTSQRNNDVATILESESLGLEPNRQLRSSLFVGGGDGTQILDHEICILNGDLNYRIDTIPRDTVVKMIRENNFSKLLERDQIMVSRRRVAGFRLAPFSELPITFAPTYKYDVGRDVYDTSEKKRSPAWCDRIVYRGPGRVKQVEYRRHEVKVSDHRPVSGIFKLRVKRVDAAKRDKVYEACNRQFHAVKKHMAEEACVKWLVDAMGMPETEARAMIVE